MGDYLRSGFTLMAFALVVALMLSAVYMLTLEPIAQAELEEKLAAIRTILSDDDGLIIADDQVPQTADALDEKIWKATDEGNLFESDTYLGFVSSPAYTFQTLDGRRALIMSGGSVAYGGDLTIIASFIQHDQQWELYRLEVLDFSKETPGLGAKIGDRNVIARFFGIPQSGLTEVVRVDQDSSVTVQRTPESLQEGKSQGVILMSDVMTGATITARAVANAINTMVQFLKSQGEVN